MGSISVYLIEYGRVVHQARFLEAAPESVATIKDDAKTINAVIAISRGSSAIIFSQIHF